MQTFIIEIADGAEPLDTREVELADLKAVRIEAARLLGAMIGNEPESFWATKDRRLCVRDKDGLAQFELHVFAVESPACTIA